jgi:RNA polymerase sigma-70 factor (ECF subfamily)
MIKFSTLSFLLALAGLHSNSQAADALSDSDLDLAKRTAHDPEAFTQLYHRYLTPVYRYHLARTGHVQEAEDLASQTFLTALESIGSFRGQGSFAAWLFGIASHKLADHFRRSHLELPLEEAEEVHSPLPLPEEAAHNRLQMAHVARVLRLISPERAEALVLCFFGGLSLREAAWSVGKSEAAVKMLVQRGLCDLQERLSAYVEVAE